MAYSPLARRTFLRGLGLSVGLPLLDAMGPRAISADPRIHDEANEPAKQCVEIKLLHNLSFLTNQAKRLQ